MLSDNIKVSVNGMEIEITKGTTLLEVSKMFSKEGRPAVIAKIGNHYVELNEVALPNTDIEFCDVTQYYANSQARTTPFGTPLGSCFLSRMGYS